MRTGERMTVALGAACLGACATVAGIEDLSLKDAGSTDAGGDVIVESTSGSSSGSSSGSGSGSSSGASPDAGSYCTGTYLFCDSFEEGLDTAVWTVQNPNGTGTAIGVDTSQAHSGTHALHVSLPQVTTQTYSSSQVVETQTFPTVGPLYFRAYFMLSNYTGAQETGVLVPYGSIADGSQGGWGFDASGQLFAGVSDTGTTNDNTRPITGQLPLMQWTCVELETDPSMGSIGFQQAGIGSPLSWITNSQGNADLTSLVAMTVGMNLTGASSAAQLWVDDLEIATTPIDCPP
jgi:hypothetical protein